MLVCRIRMCTCQNARSTNYGTQTHAHILTSKFETFDLVPSFHFSSFSSSIQLVNWSILFHTELDICRWEQYNGVWSVGRSHMKWNGSHKPALTKAYVFIWSFHVKNIHTFAVCNRLNGTDKQCRELADGNVIWSASVSQLTAILLGTENVTIHDKHVWYGKTAKKWNNFYYVVVIYAEQWTNSY